MESHWSRLSTCVGAGKHTSSGLVCCVKVEVVCVLVKTVCEGMTLQFVCRVNPCCVNTREGGGR